MSGDESPDSEDPNKDEQYHLKVSEGDVAETVLMPGDPGRVDKIISFWDQEEQKANHREYRTVTGQYRGAPISVTSTGIGGPSAAIAVEELARVGVENYIRVGSCGAIQREMDVGDLVITTGAVRQEGTSKEYVREDYPAVASPKIVSALVGAAERLGYEYHTGISMSSDSFYPGQGRPGFEGFVAEGSDEIVEHLKNANVKNIEMEAASIITLANVYGLNAGAVCTVYANRETGEFRTEGENRAAEVASLATKILHEMDEDWYPTADIDL